METLSSFTGIPFTDILVTILGIFGAFAMFMWRIITVFVKSQNTAREDIKTMVHDNRTYLQEKNGQIERITDRTAIAIEKLTDELQKNTQIVHKNQEHVEHLLSLSRSSLDNNTKQLQKIYSLQAKTS